MLLLDVDFMPSFFLSEELHEQEQYTRLRERLRQGRVMVLPAFEMSRQEDGREVVHKLAQGASMDREGCPRQCVRWLLSACLLDSTHEQCKGAVALGQNPTPSSPGRRQACTGQGIHRRTGGRIPDQAVEPGSHGHRLYQVVDRHRAVCRHLQKGKPLLAPVAQDVHDAQERGTSPSLPIGRGMNLVQQGYAPETTSLICVQIMIQPLCLHCRATSPTYWSCESMFPGMTSVSVDMAETRLCT